MPMFDLQGRRRRDDGAARLPQDLPAALHPPAWPSIRRAASRSIAMCFIVNRPADEPGFGLVRQETGGRNLRYTVRSYAPTARRASAPTARAEPRHTHRRSTHVHASRHRYCRRISRASARRSSASSPPAPTGSTSTSWTTTTCRTSPSARMVAAALKPYLGRAQGGRALLDVHLMVQPVDALVSAFAAAGADLISFHPEASLHVDRTLQLIRAAGCQSGLAFNPATSLDALEYVIDTVDLVLIMSVNPGFGGQSFIDSALRKIERARRPHRGLRARHPARGRRRHQGAEHPARRRRPARTPSWPAVRSLAARTTRRSSTRCATSCAAPRR